MIKRVLQRAARRLGYRIVRLEAQLISPETSATARSDAMEDAWHHQLLARGSVRTVFDVGANRGQTVLWLQKRFPGAQIHAFEPFHEPYAILAGYAKSHPEVHAHCLALGDVPGETTLYQHSHHTTNSLLPDSSKIATYAPASLVTPTGESQVAVARLDAFCQQRDITQIDLLKIDAQGYELKILEGAGEMLHPTRIRSLLLEVLFVEYYQRQGWADELLALLRARGYKLFGLTHVDFDAEQGWRWADAVFLPT